MSAAQASILDDLDAPLRRCIQNLEASCQSRQEALFEDYEDSKAKFLEQYPDADFELVLTPQALEAVRWALPGYLDAVDPQAQGSLESLRKSHWALQRTDVLQYFDRTVIRSRRFLTELVKFSNVTIADEKVPFVSAYAAIKEAQEARTSRLMRGKGLDSHNLWQVNDVKEGMAD